MSLSNRKLHLRAIYIVLLPILDHPTPFLAAFGKAALRNLRPGQCGPNEPSCDRIGSPCRNRPTFWSNIEPYSKCGSPNSWV